MSPKDRLSHHGHQMSSHTLSAPVCPETSQLPCQVYSLSLALVIWAFGCTKEETEIQRKKSGLRIKGNFTLCIGFLLLCIIEMFRCDKYNINARVIKG